MGIVAGDSGDNGSPHRALRDVIGGTAVEGFAQGQSQPTIPLSIELVNHAGTQGPRSLVIRLQNAGGGGTLGAKTLVTLWILDAAS